MAANQPKICTRAGSKKAGKLIIRKASQVKRKGRKMYAAFISVLCAR